MRGILQRTHQFKMFTLHYSVFPYPPYNLEEVEVYLEMGAVGTSPASQAFIKIKLDSDNWSSYRRRWNILASQIECEGNYHAPQGCLQYLMGSIGSIKSFNYDTTSTYDHLSDQDYMVCVRRESGHCKIGWSQSSDKDSFKLTRPASNYNGATGANCASDTAIILEGKNQVRG